MLRDAFTPEALRASLELLGDKRIGELLTQRARRFRE
jgi:hypothetical protein